jgi:hypothetical protein
MLSWLSFLRVCVGAVRPTTLLHAAAAAVSSKACCCWFPTLVACCSLGVFVGKSGQHAFLALLFTVSLIQPDSCPYYVARVLQLSIYTSGCCY